MRNGYNKHFLLRVLAVQNLYNEHKHDGVTVRHVFYKHIYPKFPMSYSTFYEYLAVNARCELRKLDGE